MPTLSRRALFSLMLAGAGLAACAAPPQRRQFPPLTYRHLPPFRLDVATVEVVDSYRPPQDGAHVEQRFPVRPAEAAAQWAKDRLRAVGQQGRARYAILEASVVDVPLPGSSGLTGLLADDAADRYDAVLSVRLEVQDGAGRNAGSVSARVARSRTVAQDETLDAHEQAWFDLTDALMNDLNAELEKSIPRYLGRFLR